MFKKTIAILIFLFPIIGISQNEIIISGQVIDSEQLIPVSGAVVSIKNSNSFSICDSIGRFRLKTQANTKSLLHIKHTGYNSQLIPITASNTNIDLGTILLSKKIVKQNKNHVITLSDDERIENDDSEAAVIFLHSRKDVFQRAAAFNFGPFRFRNRGLDNAYATVLINGVKMNPFYTHRPQWNNWGGLNDITRSITFTTGSSPSDYTFGNTNGTQNINSRTSEIKPQNRISFSNTNAFYNFRTMATHASGLNNNNWAYAVSASKRWANESYFEGTSYDANSLFIGIEKKITTNHSINLSAFFAKNTKGKNSYNTNEITKLTSSKYNAYWGYQNGKKRNSRIKSIFEPIFILSHYWKLSQYTTLQNNIAYQTGYQSSSRLDYNNANNPSPTYYKKLPSYYLNQFTDTHHTPKHDQANAARQHFINNKQINWDYLYFTNQQNGESVYILSNDIKQNNNFSANSILFSDITNHITIQGKIAYRRHQSTHFNELTDLLGGLYFVDTDPYLQGDQSQANLLNPNRKIKTNDKFGYNYDLTANEVNGFLQLQFNYPKWDLYWSQNSNYTNYQRTGHYQNGLYPHHSLGKSTQLNFTNLNSKIGGRYKLNGKSIFEFNGAQINQAPTLKSAFSNARINNQVTTDINDQQINSLDLSYHYKTKRIKSRITAYYAKITDESNVSYYYTEGLGVLASNSASNYNNPNAFVTEITTGIEKTNWGLECSASYKINSLFTTYTAINYGQYIYSNNPNLYLNIDTNQSQQNLGVVYLNKYKQPGMPQQAYSIGVEYRNPNYWWLSTNMNYLTDNYINISPLLRTHNFFINPNDQDQQPFNGIDDQLSRGLLKQEKLKPVYSLNILGGKSWKIKQKIIGLFVVINNLFNHQYKIGGYEQSRNANYQKVLQSKTIQPELFGSNYSYSTGRTYYINLYLKF